MKKAVSIFLSTALLTSTALASGWPSWAESGKLWAEEHAVSEEFTASSKTIVTRGMAAKLLYEAAGRPAVAGECPFSDVTGPYAKAVTWAAEQGLLKGNGDGTYAPDGTLTRQQFATLLYRQKGSPEAAPGALAHYTDREQIADWAWDGLNWCAGAGLMTGTAADRLSPEQVISAPEALLLMEHQGKLLDTKQMADDLTALTAAHRPIGSKGEEAAVQYLKERFAGMGYAVTLQLYTDGQGRSGTNVVAVKKAARPNADILVLSAHHDSVPTAYGANDNASGVAALLYAAEALKDIKSDTELRFISFTDEENGKNGSRFYTSTLSESEKERMIGDIQFDMLGGLGSNGAMLCTTDGQANWVSDLLRVHDPDLALGAETASDHSSFQLAGVPSVLLMQKGRGYLYHSSADTAEQLNLYAITDAAQTAVQAVREVADQKTSSYQDTAREQGSGYTYRQTRQNVICFDSSLADTEAFIGAPGELADHREVGGVGWTDIYDTYRYSMRWFDGKAPMNTYYEYRNGFLQGIRIHPAETGYTTEQVRALIFAMYGVPSRTGTDRQGRPYESWQDEIYSKYITLTDAGTECVVSVSKYNVGISNTLATYPVTDGQASITDPEDKKVWELLCAILPEENRQKITRFQLFTDGASGILAYTSPIREEDGTTDNTRFSISIDYYDVYDENGLPRDWSKLTYTILHEYGHVLLEDETQIDLTVSKNTHDPARFVEGSFRKAFYDTYWAELGDSAVGDYDKNPTHYVSRYGANYFHEDIADTFAVFLLGGEPLGDTVAGEKLDFFWADADMVALRAAVRQNLGLEWKGSAAPAEPEQPSGPVAIAGMDDLRSRLAEAVEAAQQPPVFEVSALAEQKYLEMDVRNAYFMLLSDHPEYKYAYDLTTRLEGDLLKCTFSYMPYRTGEHPAGFAGEEAGSLADLIRIARENLSAENTPIRISDKTLAVDDMNRALQQVGGGYLLCQLNRNGTAITVTPQNGLTHREALERLAEIDALAEQIYGECVKPGMSKQEQAEALYAYLTESVRYDFRYYSDFKNMPYESTTALGALRDHLAICGGYAQALQALLERAGIPCITVSGKFGGENHMWVQANLDGAWRTFDPTGDRGRANYGFYYFNVDAGQLPRHIWDKDWTIRLTEALSEV